jgi:hypothetical protein
VTSTSTDVSRSAYMLFVWAQFELQVGIMCASAPALRVFFRRYLGGSQQSNIGSSCDEPDKSGTVVREDHADITRGAPAMSSTEKQHQESHELRDLGTPFSEDGDGLSRSSQTIERDLTRYSHETDHVGMTAARSSWFDASEKRGEKIAGRL